MELRVDREKLLKAIAQLVRLLPGKPISPSLSCVLVEATAEWLTLTAFDLVQGLEHS
jgi:DNA polymerase III sliding clamp (beta) subunit (PCNA family)